MSHDVRPPDAVTARELMERIGLKKSAFYKREKANEFKHLRLERPVGARKYSRALVEKFFRGESTVEFRKLKRAS